MKNLKMHKKHILVSVPTTYHVQFIILYIFLVTFSNFLYIQLFSKS